MTSLIVSDLILNILALLNAVSVIALSFAGLICGALMVTIGYIRGPMLGVLFRRSVPRLLAA